MSRRIQICCVAVLMFAGSSAGWCEQLKLRICGNAVKADVVSVSDKAVTLKIDGREQSFPPALLEPAGLYLCKKAKCDPASAKDCYELGQFCLSKKLAEEGKQELLAAKKLDPVEYTSKVDALLAAKTDAKTKAPEPLKNSPEKTKPVAAPDNKEKAPDKVQKDAPKQPDKNYADAKTGEIDGQIDGTTASPNPDWAPKLPAEMTLKYKMYVPEIRDGGQEKLPLLVSLHGAGDTNANYYNMWKGYCEKNRWILVAPKSMGPTYMPQDMVRMGQLVTELKSKYPVAADKVFIHGYSNGGTTALMMAMMNPGVFSAAACMHGICSAEVGRRPEGKALKGLRLFVCGGGKDPCFPLPYVKNTVAALQGLGVTVKLHERPEAGHSYPFELNKVIPEFLLTGEIKDDAAKKE